VWQFVNADLSLLRVTLVCLPVFSLSLVQKSNRSPIAHRLFESVTQLEELLNKLLNQGGFIIKWERKIKNKGNAVY
jgi:hypothetical protein